MATVTNPLGRIIQGITNLFNPQRQRQQQRPPRTNPVGPLNSLRVPPGSGLVDHGLSSPYEIQDEYIRRFGMPGGGGGGGGGYYSGGGGGGYYSGGGGGGFDPSVYERARDEALKRVSGFYDDHVKQFDTSKKTLEKAYGEEETSRTDRVSAEEAMASAAYMAALAQRAKERAALGIEEAADVGIDTLANAQAEGAANTKVRSGISERRTQGHRDAAMKMNEDMRELTRIEGENAQQEIKEYYDAIIAQRQQEAARIAASAMSRRSYGYSGGYSGGGSSGEVSTHFLNAMNKHVEQVMNYERTARNETYGAQRFQMVLSNVQRQYGDAPLSTQIRLADRLVGNSWS